MDHRRLDENEYKATMTQGMRDVTQTTTAILDIWPYADAIPAEELEGHPLNDVELVYRSQDQQFEHVLIATDAKNIYLTLVLDVLRATIVGHYLLDLNKEYGLPVPGSQQEGTETGYVCQTCGQFHAELPMDFGADAPAAYYSIPVEQREARCDLTSDLCMIDEQEFFVRGCLEIPVLDGSRPFVWGVWTSLSKRNFKRMGELWQTQGREAEPPYFGWLCTSLPLYPETLLLKTNVRNRPVGQRPCVELEPTDHPLAVEQRNGITMNRVREIAEALLHQT